MAKTPQELKEEAKQNMILKPMEGSHIKKLIGIVSGKGGVGKSFVTGLTASAMAKKGHSVAIMDADITGPSIPKMFGVSKLEKVQENALIPVESAGGIKIMSLNLLMEHDTDPVIWRGPVITGVVQQFWNEVVWGDVDYMFVDMPPGTGDVPLTVYQTLPIDGIIIVTTPQDLVGMIVEKAYHMAEMMDVPVFGIVENMSYLKCPHCGQVISVFGESTADKEAARLGLDVVGRLPIDPSFAAHCDAGEIEKIDNSYMDTLLARLEDLLK